MDRIFLDANVTFSAAYDPASRIATLWTLPDVVLFTSEYALAEALRNLQRKAPRSVPQLARLLHAMRVIATPQKVDTILPAELPFDDAPILRAAIACSADYLLTGDTDFLPYFGRIVKGVLILRPSDYFKLREL